MKPNIPWRISGCGSRHSGGIFDYDTRKERLEEVLLRLEDPAVWSDPTQAQKLGQERARLEETVQTLDDLDIRTHDAIELLELVRAEDDAEALTEIERDVLQLGKRLGKLEFLRMFAGELDIASAFVDIQAGSGGTEAQDWAEMLLRMYLRWAEDEDLVTELVEKSEGEVAGIKSATVHLRGEYAYGKLRTETGVHRLVRKSPFDSGNRRHTSFASVFVYPEIDDSIEIEINPADLRIDTYRASGAGGQHVNRTDSAVRITHLPSGIVVQCQNDRSQHRNKAEAMTVLRARLYEAEMRERREQQQQLEDSKADIGWGSQIRSYVLDQSRIKDLRTGVETGNTQAVLDGDLNPFIEASLKAGL
ncbi:MAG: peptide chain release factor 2 [Arenicellales bacterium]|nr:peptide chain release factor 2 [Arenicellales bacterium]MDP7119294.1 peptide chain release factor 2 [Arenicellales bacterium]MDP7490294.1 peptide chain release factor 2 [Arenicellales bacterium]MEE1558811.1 peptide chain release factor 2 [Arenicellales bacterium]